MSTHIRQNIFTNRTATHGRQNRFTNRMTTHRRQIRSTNDTNQTATHSRKNRFTIERPAIGIKMGSQIERQPSAKYSQRDILGSRGLSFMTHTLQLKTLYIKYTANYLRDFSCEDAT